MRTSQFRKVAPKTLTEPNHLKQGDSHGIDTFLDHTFHLYRRAGKRFSSSVDCNPDITIPADPDRRWHSFIALSMASPAPIQILINGRSRTGSRHASCRHKLIFLSGRSKIRALFLRDLPLFLVRRSSQTSGLIPAQHFRGRKGASVAMQSLSKSRSSASVDERDCTNRPKANTVYNHSTPGQRLPKHLDSPANSSIHSLS